MSSEAQVVNLDLYFLPPLRDSSLSITVISLFSSGGGGDSQWSVTSVLFQGDNHLISSGAKDGTIKVWDLRQLYQTSGFVLRGKVDPTPAHVLSYAGMKGVVVLAERWAVHLKDILRSLCW